MPAENRCVFLADGITFRVPSDADKDRFLYAPLCGIDGASVKSAITPCLSGDIKLDRQRYLTKPASREDLRIPVRNFFARTGDGKVVSMAGAAADTAATVEIGQLWHKVTRLFPEAGLEVCALSFVPVSGEKLELTRFRVKNISPAAVVITPTAAVPVFARSLSNKHDHEHVTALLNRVAQLSDGIVAEPTMRFNEEGHKPCSDVYFVFGADGKGQCPAGTFPTQDSFYGRENDFNRPRAVFAPEAPRLLPEVERQGLEIAGALRFSDTVVPPGEARDFIMAIGVAQTREEARAMFVRFNTTAGFDAALDACAAYWTEKTSSIVFDNGDRDFSAWMRWVTLQPVLRRIFGCSFLPDHDYGKGGKGWRDIWQDLLSLILIEPSQVRRDLLNNFAGIRTDGSNATIIGQKPGEFIADRNAITRVWMDHGVWPLLTTLLYVDQTGDDAFLLEQMPYFSDPQLQRALARDAAWVPASGNQVKDARGEVYRGTVLEHLLIQNLVQFYNVGEHNITRLESADWNDGLDMAFKRGESVAFMAFYAGNLLALAKLLERLSAAGAVTSLVLAEELLLLLDTMGGKVNYDDAAAKRARLFTEYFRAVQPEVSGKTVTVDIVKLANDLRLKGAWVMAHIRRQEKVSVDADGEAFAWYNGYYDDNGEPVEGRTGHVVRMTLTGQVFPLMFGVADDAAARAVARAVVKFLKDPQSGGYRLNTDFGVRHYLSLGRAFAFAYGTKENGAVFSHMCVMYAYALYNRGMAAEGHDVLRSLYRMSMDFSRAHIYPGIPEYFDAAGCGMYHFLTGSASWYVLTLLTKVYGVRGSAGDLVLAPQLTRQEFGPNGEARVKFQFAGRTVTVVYLNPASLDAGAYRVRSVEANGTLTAAAACPAEAPHVSAVRIPRAAIAAVPQDIEYRVLLSA
ncbi:MAG: cellobiose phosphorylase [Candidatus Omnitrophota bacterium]